MAQIIPPAVGAALGDHVLREMTEFASKALGRWGGNLFQTWKIRDAVGHRRVLGANYDLKRKTYAESPILRTITHHCIKVPGTVFVFYAPGGMGKTTACHAIMGRYAKKGVAFSPGELSCMHYHKMMLSRLAIDADNQPHGWLEKLLDELSTPWGEDPAVLLLDDFMNDDPHDILDQNLLKTIKGIIRGKNVVAIAFTTNLQSANKMITWNDMTSIVPAAPKEDILRYRFLLSEHHFSRAKNEFSIDWNEQGRMRWETTELKKAILFHPAYVEKRGKEKDVIVARIDKILQDTQQEQRDLLNPQHILMQLFEWGTVDILESPRDGWAPTWSCGHFWRA